MLVLAMSTLLYNDLDTVEKRLGEYLYACSARSNLRFPKCVLKFLLAACVIGKLILAISTVLMVLFLFGCSFDFL
jgi:hypothetical protein